MKKKKRTKKEVALHLVGGKCVGCGKALSLGQGRYSTGETCEHAGCLSHVTIPCEGCGRTAGELVCKACREAKAHALPPCWDDCGSSEFPTPLERGCDDCGMRENTGESK